MDEIRVSTSPWIPGTQAIQYYGPIRTEIFIEDSTAFDRSEVWEKADNELLESLLTKARALGANAIVGLERTMDPFIEREDGPSGLLFSAVGTAALLGKLEI